MATTLKVTHHQSSHNLRGSVVLCGEITAEITENAIGDYRAPLGEIDIAMNDGTYGRFHLYAKIKRGRPVLEISTNSADGSRSIVKQLAASKRPRN